MKHSKTSLFLMELIVAILFFSLAAAVCLNMFSRASSIRKQTKAMNNSTILYDNFCALYNAYDGDLAKVIREFGGKIDEPGNCILLPLDKDFNEISLVYSSYVCAAYYINGASDNEGLRKVRFVIFDRDYTWRGETIMEDSIDFSRDYVDLLIKSFDYETIIDCEVSKYLQQGA